MVFPCIETKTVCVQRGIVGAEINELVLGIGRNGAGV